jgi:hypothetical protein
VEFLFVDRRKINRSREIGEVIASKICSRFHLPLARSSGFKCLAGELGLVIHVQGCGRKDPSMAA